MTHDRGRTYVAIMYPAHDKMQFSLAFSLCAGQEGTIYVSFSKHVAVV
jgi:hypothetical protein